MIEAAPACLGADCNGALNCWWPAAWQAGAVRWCRVFNQLGRANVGNRCKRCRGHLGLGVLVLFLISGLSWAGIWGGQDGCKAWSSFHRLKVGRCCAMSDDIHANMNHHRREVPWALNKRRCLPLAATRGLRGRCGGGHDSAQLDAAAREMGFDARYQMNLPQGDTGVWNAEPRFR